MNVIIVRVRADVDNSVHVEVKIVELGNLMFLDHLAQAWIPLRQPSVKLWDSHFQG